MCEYRGERLYCDLNLCSQQYRYLCRWKGTAVTSVLQVPETTNNGSSALQMCAIVER